MSRNQAFEFKAEPTALSSNYKPLYRPRFSNVMHDQRVIRGKTINNPKLDERLVEMTKRQLYRREPDDQFDPSEILTPRPPEGKSYATTMTDPIYEALDTSSNYNNVKIQTDPALNVPITIKYNIRKTGVDSSTQVVEEDLKYVYNPKKLDSVVRVLLNKILEESRMEVLEENEFLAMQNAKNVFRQQKMKLLNQVQRIEQKEQRIAEEKQRRVVESQNANENAVWAHKKLVSRLFAKNVIEHAQKKSFSFLENRNTYFEQRYSNLYLKFLPWFFDNIEFGINKSQEIRTGLADTIEHLESHLLEKHNSVVRDHKMAIYKKIMNKTNITIDTRQRELNRDFSLPEDMEDLENKSDTIKEIRRHNTLN